MKKYDVTYKKVCYLTIIVEADSKKEACELADDINTREGFVSETPYILENVSENEFDPRDCEFT